VYWNYKAAFSSALVRGLLFFATNLSAGWQAASGAFLAECAFRICTAGFYGALTERIGRLEPERRSMLTAIIVLPALAHSLEYLLHWARGTPNLQVSLIASVGFTIISTAFNVYCMRRGVLTCGPGSGSMLDDLRRLPRLVRDFVL
jgi:hypothetical protein